MLFKRLVAAAAFAAVFMSVGCYSFRDSWCERHCGCRQAYPAGYYAPAPAPQVGCCVPCCPAPANYPPAPAGSWASPRPANPCCP